jgi:hypothetical protein
VSQVPRLGRIGLICSGSGSVAPTTFNHHIVIPNPDLLGEESAFRRAPYAIGNEAADSSREAVRNDGIFDHLNPVIANSPP